MAVVAIDTSKNARLAVVLTHETVRRVNVYRTARAAETGKIPSQSAALAELIEIALQHFEQQQARKHKP